MKRPRSKQRILCLWLPAWPLQRVRLARPELKRCPLSLYQSQRGALRVIASDRYPAGTPLAEVVVGKAEQHDPVADQSALLDLAAWCEQFSPIVGVEASDNLCLDVTGLDQLFGSEHAIVNQIMRAFGRRGLAIRLAIADTIGAAWALAHYGTAPWTVVRWIAELRPLPVEALRLDGEVEMLAELGVKCIGQLLEIPREALVCRFGPHLLMRLNQAMGNIPQPVTSHRPPPEILLERSFEYPVENRQALEEVLGDLLKRAASEIEARQQGALQVRCDLRSEQRAIDFTVGLFRPSASAGHLLELATMQLDRIALPGPIDRVTVAMVTSAPLSTWQQELFDDSRREDRRRVGLLVDRLSNRLGREAVVRARPQQEAQPELAVRYEPLAGVMQSKSKQRFRTLPRPLRLEVRPQPIEALAVIPDGPPRQFRWRGDHHVRRAWGPERIQTGWWRGRYVQRDYYRVETDAGKRFWLFRELRSDDWFLHGAFD